MLSATRVAPLPVEAPPRDAPGQDGASIEPVVDRLDKLADAVGDGLLMADEQL